MRSAALPPVLLAAVAFAAGVVVAVTLAGAPVAAQPTVKTAALEDVAVRQGGRAVFSYRADDLTGRPLPLALQISQGGRRIVTVHLGMRRPGAVLCQKLTIALAPGRYVWTVAAEDPFTASSATVARLTVR